MTNVKILFTMTLIVGVSQIANSQERSTRDNEKQKRDQLRITVQTICPISGRKLGDHGSPIKVTVGKDKEVIFLCCKKCLKRKINPKHWAKIHTNFAQAQRICPVMKKPLPKSPKWTIVEGQIVYICCPPCTQKIAAAPKAYLQKIDQLYTASIKQRQRPRTR